MRVRDLMTRPVHTVRTDTPIEQAAALLTERRITAVPVLDEAGRLAGIVSEADLLWRRVRRDLPPEPEGAGEPERARLVGEVMTKGVAVTSPDADLAEVAERMIANDVHSIPVVDESFVVGMISRSDLLRTLVRSDDVLAIEAQERLDEYSGDVRRWTVTATDGRIAIGGDFDDDVERRVVTILAGTVPGVRSAEIVAVLDQAVLDQQEPKVTAD